MFLPASFIQVVIRFLLHSVTLRFWLIQLFRLIKTYHHLWLDPFWVFLSQICGERRATRMWLISLVSYYDQSWGLSNEATLMIMGILFFGQSDQLFLKKTLCIHFQYWIQLFQADFPYFCYWCHRGQTGRKIAVFPSRKFGNQIDLWYCQYRMEMILDFDLKWWVSFFHKL